MGHPSATITRSASQPHQRHRRSFQWIHPPPVLHKLDSAAGATGTSVFQLPGRHILVPPWAAIFVYAVIIAFLILTGAGFVLSYNARREFRRRLAEQAEAQALLTPPPVSANELKSFTRRSILLLNNTREPSTYSPPFRMSRAGVPLPTNIFENCSRHSVLIAEVVPDLGLSADEWYRLTRGSPRASFWHKRSLHAKSLHRADVQFEMLTQQAPTSNAEASEVIDGAALARGQDSTSLTRTPIQNFPPPLVTLITPPAPDSCRPPGSPEEVQTFQQELDEKHYAWGTNPPKQASFEDDAPEPLAHSTSMRNVAPSLPVRKVSKTRQQNEASLATHLTPRPTIPSQSPSNSSSEGLMAFELPNDMPPPRPTRNSADPDLAMAVYAASRRAPSPVVSTTSSLRVLAQFGPTGLTPLDTNLPRDVLVSSPISTEPTVSHPWQIPTVTRTHSGKLPLIPERALRDPEELAKSASITRSLPKNRSRTPTLPKRHAMLFRSRSTQEHIRNSSKNSTQNPHHEQRALEPILEYGQGVRRSNSMSEVARPAMALPPPAHKKPNLLRPPDVQGLPSRPVRHVSAVETLPGLASEARRPSPLGSSARKPPPRIPLSGTMSSGGVRNSSFVP